MRIYLTVYDHRYGADYSAFKSEVGAYADRDRIARENWQQEFPDEPMPETDIGETYFGKAERIEEFWNVFEVELKP